MLFEMACYRGTMVWLDGEKPGKKWGCGTEGNALTTSDLTIGPHKVEKIEVFGPPGDDCDPEQGCYYVFDGPLVPKEIELTTAAGKWRGPVTKVVAGEEIDPYHSVVLADGETYEIDEITLYLRAILQPIS